MTSTSFATDSRAMDGQGSSGRIRRWSRRDIGENVAGYILILPWLLGFVAWSAVPMCITIMYSFSRYNLYTPPVWIGLDNYRAIMQDDLIAKALYNTAYLTFIGVPLHTITSLAVAVLLNQSLRGMALFRTVYYLPTIVPEVATVLVWLWLLNPDFGLLNVALYRLGLPRMAWFQDVNLAKPALLMMGLWGFGGTLVLFLAALQNVPVDLLEAAWVDGAGRWRRFLHVTLPMISPVTFFIVVMGIIGSMQAFTGAYIATGGGPANATLLYVLYLFRQAFQYTQFGYASAMGWLLFLIIMALTLTQLYVSKRWVYYESEPTS
jgi:multiple sugar transport system permease protein